MTSLPKKTYGRRNKNPDTVGVLSLPVCYEEEKENIWTDKNDKSQFDQLISSPLKQNVDFKPLSFWNKKINDLESKKKSTKQKKGKKNQLDLYELSDSDDSNSSEILKYTSKRKKAKPRLKAPRRNQKGYNLKFTKDFLKKKNTETIDDSEVCKSSKVLCEKGEKEDNNMIKEKPFSGVSLTSTPGRKTKTNAVGLLSHFNFLSPIQLNHQQRQIFIESFDQNEEMLVSAHELTSMFSALLTRERQNVNMSVVVHSPVMQFHSDVSASTKNTTLINQQLLQFVKNANIIYGKVPPTIFQPENSLFKELPALTAPETKLQSSQFCEVSTAFTNPTTEFTETSLNKTKNNSDYFTCFSNFLRDDDDDNTITELSKRETRSKDDCILEEKEGNLTNFDCVEHYISLSYEKKIEFQMIAELLTRLHILSIIDWKNMSAIEFEVNSDKIPVTSLSFEMLPLYINDNEMELTIDDSINEQMKYNYDLSLTNSSPTLKNVTLSPRNLLTDKKENLIQDDIIEPNLSSYITYRSPSFKNVTLRRRYRKSVVENVSDGMDANQTRENLIQDGTIDPNLSPDITSRSPSFKNVTLRRQYLKSDTNENAPEGIDVKQISPCVLNHSSSFENVTMPLQDLEKDKENVSINGKLTSTDSFISALCSPSFKNITVRRGKGKKKLSYSLAEPKSCVGTTEEFTTSQLEMSKKMEGSDTACLLNIDGITFTELNIHTDSGQYLAKPLGNFSPYFNTGNETSIYNSTPESSLNATEDTIKLNNITIVQNQTKEESTAVVCAAFETTLQPDETEVMVGQPGTTVEEPFMMGVCNMRKSIADVDASPIFETTLQPDETEVMMGQPGTTVEEPFMMGVYNVRKSIADVDDSFIAPPIFESTVYVPENKTKENEKVSYSEVDAPTIFESTFCKPQMKVYQKKRNSSKIRISSQFDPSTMAPPIFESTICQTARQTLTNLKVTEREKCKLGELESSQLGALSPILESQACGKYYLEDHSLAELDASSMAIPMFESTVCPAKKQNIHKHIGRRPRESEKSMVSVAVLSPIFESASLQTTLVSDQPEASEVFQSFKVPQPSTSDVFKLPKPRTTRKTLALRRFTEQRPSIINASKEGDVSITLKTGKQWTRSLSLLKQLHNGSLARDADVANKGRRFQEGLEEVVQLQTSAWQESMINQTLDTTQNMTMISSKMANMTITNCTTASHSVKLLTDERSCDPLAFSSFVADSLISEVSLAAGTVPTYDVRNGDTARRLVLARCGQDAPVPFEKHFNRKTLKNCKKIGEGVYGEVFMYNNSTVIKIIPIEGSDLVNGEPQKKFSEIISEIVIAMELSNLRFGVQNRTNGFSEMKRCWCVVGEYPEYLVDLWNNYDIAKGSENDTPTMFKPDQLYIILELANGGHDLESFVFNSAEQSLSILIQTAYTLAVAEKALEFEHRDLHWGNLLISRTDNKTITFVLDGETHNVLTKGVQVAIIDFTLSRMTFDGCCIFNDLSVDPSLFTSQGDFQFEVYRLMKKEVQNDWSLFKPRTNVIWLLYLIDKMLTLVRYRRKDTKIHFKNLKHLEELKESSLSCRDTYAFVSSV